MRLVIRMLGTFEASVDDEPVVFESDSARALLAYLATETTRVFSRAVVAEMLWPERPRGAALSNLRHVLSVLRRTLGDGAELLESDRSTIRLRDGPELWVDLAEFEEAAAILADSDGAVEQWERAADLWRGPVLEGLQVRAGAEWEEWQVVLDERVRRALAATLHRLVDHYERSGEPERALPMARRLAGVNEWDERAHRHVMRLLARCGESGQAIAYYDQVTGRFHAELGVDLGATTVALAEQIRTGELVGLPVEVAYPEFLSRPGVAPPLFVGRVSKLAALDAHLEEALAGNGRVVLIAGEAGSGKTMLAAEFMRQASEHPGLLVARGRCNAYGGLGDPYLPFREILGMLSGDVQTSFGSGSVDREQATRLWEAIPETARLVSERGPSLLGVMVTGAPLLQRVEAAVPGIGWLDDLSDHVAAASQRPPAPERMQPALFDEYTAVLEGIASAHPLVLLIDDLQWADPGSIALLWHLARRLEGLTVLIVGAYRPEEVVEGHALQPVLAELRTAAPDCTIELGADRGFVDDYLDSEPNDLDAEFRERLFSYTNGHPLFTAEMVRGMQDRAEIRRTTAGVWTASDALKWDRLPGRVEAAVAQRIGRLPDELQRDLIVAAVQGESFIAEAAATVRGDDESSARLSREAMAPGRLIEPAEVTRVNSKIVSRHRFRHILFQRYLYEQHDEAARIRLHEATGRALEDLYQGHPEPPVVDLAYHFDEAGLVEPAIGYLHQAGQRAFSMSANEEAIQHIERSLELLMTLAESGEREQRELELLVLLGAGVTAVRGFSSLEAQRIGNRVWELCERLEPSPMGVMGLTTLSQTRVATGKLPEAADASRAAVAIAQATEDPSLEMLASAQLGFCISWMGDFIGGHETMRRAWRLYDPDRDAWLIHVFGADPGLGLRGNHAFNTWFRGYPDQALVMVDEAVARARRRDHAFTLGYALFTHAGVRWLRREYQALSESSDELEKLAVTEHLPYLAAGARFCTGSAVGHLRDPERGISLIRESLGTYGVIGNVMMRGLMLAEAAQLNHLKGSSRGAIELAEQAQQEAHATGEGLSELFASVTKASLLKATGDASSEAELKTAIDAAHAKGARSFELRAATELASLYEEKGRIADARTVLEPIFNWFTEGHDTQDLIDARKVLERL